MTSDTEVTPGSTLSLGSDSPSRGPGRNKFLVAGAIGIGVLGIVYLYKKKQDSTASAAAATTSTPATSVAGSGTYEVQSNGESSADASQYYDALATQIQNGTNTTASNISTGTNTVTNAIGAAQQQIDQQITTQPTTTTTPTQAQTTTPTMPSAPTQQFAGSGYGPMDSQPVTGTNGHVYEWLPNQAAVQAAQSNHTPIDYEPTLLNFQPITSSFTGWANTPIFEQVS